MGEGVDEEWVEDRWSEETLGKSVSSKTPNGNLKNLDVHAQVGDTELT